MRARAHSPSPSSLLRGSQGERAPVHLRTPATAPREVLTFSPGDAGTIAEAPCSALGLRPETVAMGDGSTEPHGVPFGAMVAGRAGRRPA